MPDNDLLRRSLDAGVAFTQLTRKRAESIVRDLVKNGEISREQATARVEELLERSRQNTDAVLALVRKEIDERIAALNLVTREELANLAGKLGMPGLQAKAPKASDLAAPTTSPAASPTKRAAPPKRIATAKAPTAKPFTVNKAGGTTKVAPAAAAPAPPASAPSAGPPPKVARPGAPAKKAAKSAKKA